MKKEKQIEFLRKARNILHKQENGKPIFGNEIITAHDCVAIVLDDLIFEDFKERKERELLKHFVFTAGNFPENQKAIDNAINTTHLLESRWEMNAECTGYYDGSTIVINTNDGNNTSICMKDDNLFRLINSCMEFARELEKMNKQQTLYKKCWIISPTLFFKKLNIKYLKIRTTPKFLCQIGNRWCCRREKKRFPRC